MGGRLAEHVAHGAALPAEVEEGNVEYKYRIRRAGDARLHELATQLRWRLAEAGDATYMLGVEDDGSVPGIRADALAESLDALEAMCAIAGARLAHVERVRVCRRPELWAAEVLVSVDAGRDAPRRTTVKVAFVGPSGAGKTTLVGVLARAGVSPRVLDDGCGGMRLECLRHRHEVLSGRTSSVAVESLAFAGAPGALRPVSAGASADGVLPVEVQGALLAAPHVVQLFDLAGDDRYRKTTYAALSSAAGPDWLAVVASCADVLGRCVSDPAPGLDDSLALAIGLEMPYVVVLTGADRVAAAHEAVPRVHAAVERVRVRLFGADAVRGALARCSKKTGGLDSATLGPAALFVPAVHVVSCVTGAGIDNLVSAVGRLRPRRSVRLHGALDALDAVPPVVCVESVHRGVPDAGTVLGGTVLRGIVEAGARLAVGPLADGSFLPLSVRSLRRLRLPVRMLQPGDVGTLAVDLQNEDAGLSDALALLSCSPPVSASISGDQFSSPKTGSPESTHEVSHRRRNSLSMDDRLARAMFVVGVGPDGGLPNWAAAMVGPDIDADVVLLSASGAAPQMPSAVHTPMGSADSAAGPVAENVHGVVYWMGTRHAAVLVALREFYLADRLRATLRLEGGARVAALPGARLIFVSASGALRVVGQPVAAVRVD